LLSDQVKKALVGQSQELHAAFWEELKLDSKNYAF